jgi:hypothetical protein
MVAWGENGYFYVKADARPAEKLAGTCNIEALGFVFDV